MRIHKVAKRLVAFREHRGMTQEALSEKTNLPLETVQSYENGEKRLNPEDGILIARALDFDPYFIGIQWFLDKKIPTSPLAPLEIVPAVSPKQFFSRVWFVIKNALKKRRKDVVEPMIENELFSAKDAPGASPFVFLRIAIILLLIAGIAFLAESIVISNLALSLVVPFSLLWLLFENHHPRAIRGYELVIYFFIGGLLAIVTVFAIRFFTGYLSSAFAGSMLTGVVEELAKIIIIILIVRKRRIQHMLEGVLIGFAVGAGFSVFETTQYGIEVLLQTKSLVAMLLEILVRSGYNLIGVGHNYWAGIMGGVLAMTSRTGHLKLRDIFHSTVFVWYLIVAAIHAFYDYTIGISNPWAPYALGFLSMMLFIIVWLKAKQEYVTETTPPQPIEPIPAEPTPVES